MKCFFHRSTVEDLMFLNIFSRGEHYNSYNDGTSVTCSDDCGRRFLRSSPNVAGGSGQSSWWRVKQRCVRKAGMGALILNILSKYSEAFSSMIEGKNEEMSTSELSGGARTHYIFWLIFVKSLEEVDPCEDLTDEDIQTAIQNAVFFVR
ncbi:dynamin-related protein 3A-like protein isoform X2, partial [Tanacetum coccineum]